MSNPARPALLGSLAVLLAAGGFVLGRASVPHWPLGGTAPRPTPPATLVAATTLAAAATPSPGPTLPPVLAAMEAAQAPGRPAAPAAAPPAAPPASTAPEPQHPPLADPAPVAVEAPRRRPARSPAAPPPASVAPAPPATVPPLPPPPAPRRFVQGKTVTENLKGAKKGGLAGFDSSGVGVRRAPEVVGNLDIEMTPEEVRAGESYAVRIFLANQGRKTIQLNGLSVAVVADGKRTARTMAPRTREIAPRERVLLTELPGVWREGLENWAVEVNATSTRQDSYRNDLRLQ